jgi:hypothetical protein
MTLKLDTLVTFETSNGLLGEGQLVNFLRGRDGSTIAIVVDHYAGKVRQMPLAALAKGEKDVTAPLPLLLGKHDLDRPVANVQRAFPLKPYETVNFYDLVSFNTVQGSKTGNILRFERDERHALVATVESGVIGVWKVPVAAMELKRRLIDGGMAGPEWTLSASEQKRFEARLRIKVVEKALEKFPENVRQGVLDRASQAIGKEGAQLPAAKWAARNEPRRAVDRQGPPKAAPAGVARLAVVNGRGTTHERE